MAVLPTDYTDSVTPTGATTEYPATTTRGLNATHTQVNTNTTDIATKATLAAVQGNLIPDGNATRGLGSTSNYWADVRTVNINTPNVAFLDADFSAVTNLVGPAVASGTTCTLPNTTDTLVGKATTDTLTNKTIDGTNNTLTIRAADIPSGITNGNTALQTQIVVSGTVYYITGSNLNLPATLKTGMAVGTRFRWTVAMAKTNAGTGAFAIRIFRGTNGTTADTADVNQTIGTQTAAVDSMTLDVEVVVTTTGATGAYYWSIIPTSKAVTATGFGVATGATGQFSGTVSSVAMNTASLKFGLGFSATTGTPTITVPMVRAQALNIS